MALFRQRLLWIGIVVIFVVIIVFGAAMMGSTLGAKPKELPVALVVLDQAAELPTGESLAVGAMVREKLLSNTLLPIQWEIVGSEAEARKGMDEQKYYGTLVLPADLSHGLMSLSTSAPKSAAVQLITNEGMNAQASAAVKQILQQVLNGVSMELSAQLLGQIGQQTDQISVEAAKAFLTPINVEEELVHPVGLNNANGNAPGLLTQTIWIGSLVTGLLLFMISRQLPLSGARKWTYKITQTIVGLVVVAGLSGLMVWMASSWYGMELVQAADTWLFLWLTGAAFFLLQSALLNWIGLPSMGILVLLMFFSMPLLNIAPEFLSQGTRDWLYSWTPLRFGAAGLREVMYFGGIEAVSTNAAVLWGIAGTFLVVLLASALKKSKVSATNEASAGVLVSS